MNHRIAYRTRIAVVALLGLPLGVRGGDIKIVEGIPPGFEMVRLTHDPTMLHSVPDINDKSEVVFGKFIPQTEVWDLYLFADGRIRKITEDDTIEWNPAINNSTEIAWYHLDDLRELPNADLKASFAPKPVQTDAMLIGAPAMNDAGDIVWAQRIERGVSEFDIYLYTHATGRVEPLTDGGNNQSPRINNAGEVTWTILDFSVSPWIGHIMLYSDGAVTELTQEICQCQISDINDNGDAVWQDEEGVQYWNGESSVQIAAPAGAPRINNRVEIAFGLWDFDLELWRHSVYKDGVVYVLPSLGLTTFRENINDRSEMAMKSIHPQTGNSDLFLLRRIAPKGDFNHDCHVDLYDFWIFQRCVTAQPGPEGALLAECIRGDFDDDGDIDPGDLAAFIVTYTGPGTTVGDCEL